MTPTDTQWAAVRAIVDWYKGGRSTPQVFYLAGYAGTGKSTIFKIALEELQRAGLKTHALATFTGKAASVLRKKGNYEAQTIHSLIYIPDDEVKRPHGELGFMLNETGPASEVDLIGLDECSMVDEAMGQDVLSFGKKVLVMGDPGQLPPVKGEGFFTKLKPDVMLTEVHRQALNSPILRLATRARMGEQIPFGAVDAGEDGFAQVLPLQRRHEGLCYREDTQVICGVHRVRKTVTARIRHARGFGGTLPMAGEMLMCIKNNRDLGLFNGLQGTLASQPEPYVRRDGDDASLSELVTMSVRMDDVWKPIDDLLVHPWAFASHFGDVEQPRMRKGVEWFDWGFVLTCHKSQGSEWPDVTVIDDGGSFKEDCHRWRYTAITRAAERLTILRRG